MPSKTEALVRNFLKTDGDALYLVPGEKIFLVKGTNKIVVGRENLSDESFRAVSAELVPGAPAESLAAMKHRTPFRVDESSEPVEIQFGRSGSSVAIMICRVRTQAPEPEPEPMPIPQPVTPPRPAAPARPAGGTGSYSVPAAPAAPAPRSPAEVVPLDVPDSLSQGPSQDMDASLARLSGPRRRSDRPLDEALRRLKEREGSDLHVVPGAPPAFRVSGELVVAEELPPFAPDDIEKALLTLLPDRGRRELEAEGATSFAYDHPDAGRLRVRMARERGGIAAEFRRVLVAPPKAEQLGLPPAAVRLLGLPFGLLLVAGPPGSGKTTARASLLAHALAERPRALLLVEDPPEIPVPRGRGLVSSRAVGVHAPSTAAALRGARDGDWDVLAAPEPRDAESLALLLDAAARRLVLVEVTAASIAEAVDRFSDPAMGDRHARVRELLSVLLRGVLVERLVPLAAGGRVPVFDLLLVTGASVSYLREGKTFQLSSLLQAGKMVGMVQANDMLAELVKRKAVALPTALAASPDPAALRAALGAAEGGAVPEAG